MSVTPTSDLMTLAQTAAYLGMSEKGLRWHRHQQTAPPAAKIGGRVVFSRKRVDAWIDAKFEESL